MLYTGGSHFTVMPQAFEWALLYKLDFKAFGTFNKSSLGIFK